jgi:hypothetical protein
MRYLETPTIIKVWRSVAQPLCRAIAPAWPVALSVALLFPVGSPARAQEIEINVTFDQYFDRVLPSPALTITHYDMHVYFSPNGDVVHSERKYVGRGLISRIDESFHIGRRDKLEWLKVDNDTLMNVFEYKSFQSNSRQVAQRNLPCANRLRAKSWLFRLSVHVSADGRPSRCSGGSGRSPFVRHRSTVVMSGRAEARD